MDSIYDVIKHYGVPGMKWGVRKDRKASSGPADVKVTQKRPGGRVTAKGGQHQPASEDAKKVAAVKQKAKASTTDALSNDELQIAIRRMQLETQYSQLATRTARGPMATGKRIVKALTEGNKAANDINSIIESPAAKKVGQQIKNRRATSK